MTETEKPATQTAGTPAEGMPLTQEETMTGEKKLNSVVVQEEYPTEWTCYPADEQIDQQEQTSQPQNIRAQAATASGSYLANFFG